MGPSTIWLPTTLLVTLLLLLHYAHYADAQIERTMRPWVQREPGVCSGSANGRADLMKSVVKGDRYEDLRKMFQNCTRVYGNVEITHLSKANIGNRTIDFLDDIEEVKGYIFIGYTDIEKISLKKLNIIRGDTLIDDKAVLMVEGAKNLRVISMPKLRTIEKGQIFIRAAKKLCHLQETVNIDEILDFDHSRIGYYNDSDSSVYCATKKPKPACHASCNGACWGPGADECQIVYRSICQKHCESKQCYVDAETNQTNCCHSQCIGGCYGPTAKDCFACSHFTQCIGDGSIHKNCKCVEQCTSLKKYNNKLGQVEMNPDGFYSMDNRYCVKECPVERLVQDDVCVEHCGPGMNYDPNRRDKICRKCDGECPISCKFEGMIDSRNIKELTNCSEIEGYVQILASTFTGYDLPGNRSCTDPKKCPVERLPGLVPSDLAVLKTVRFISEYLYVATADNNTLTSLSFFENLEIIEGRNLLGGRQALVISSNAHLRELGLRKLKLVDKGDIIISNNYDLCYLDSFNWTEIVNTGVNHTATIIGNRAANVCNLEGFVCASSCDPAFGCVGPSASDCRKCVHWQQDGECREKCSERGFFPNEQTKTCDRCFAECDKCRGPAPTDCTSCRSFKLFHKPDDEPTVEELRRPKAKADDDEATTASPSDLTLPPSEQQAALTQFICVPECDPAKYYVDKGECKRCHRSCYDYGCDGPSNEPGPKGCRQCKFAQVNKPEANTTIGTIERCLYNSDKLHPYAVCTNNDLIDHFAHVPSHPEIVVEFECAPCDDECSTCQSLGNSRIAHGCKCKNMVAYHPIYQHKAGGAAKKWDEKCVANCSSSRGMFYDNDTIEADVAGVCRFCSLLCERPENGLGCTGPKDSDCIKCSTTMAYAHKTGNVTMCVKKETCHELGLYTYERDRLCSETDLETRDKMHKAALYILVALFLVVVLIVALILWRRQKRLSKELEQEKVLNNPEMPELIPMDLNGPMINKTKLNLIPKNALSRSVKELGSGAFGVVYAGCWMPTLNKGKPTKIPVAIKVVRDPSGRAQSEMLDEATKMTMLRHENLLRIVGVCLSGDDLQLVTLLRPLGNLREFLQKHKFKLSGKELLQYSYQIASGMKYLADQRVVHRDLAARNVLVKNTQHVEITDFGLAKLIDIGDTSVQVGEGKVAIKWLALEALEKQVYNTATDVWAFGVTVWEILKFGESPYTNMTPMAIKEFLLNGGRLEQPSNCSTEMYKILIDCWLPNPDSRPTFAVLKEILYKNCKAPWYFVTNTDQHEAMDMDDCSQRGLIEEILDETDFEDPQNYFDSEPNTPGCVTSSDIFNPMGVRRMDSLGSQRYAQDPTTRKEFGMNDDNYLVPNSSAAEMGATMYTPVVVDETGNSSLVESDGYYNEVKPGAEYINDTQNLKKSIRNSRDDRLSMIEEDDGMLEKESCL